MRAVKVKFNRTDLFNKFFNEEFVNSNKEKIQEIGVDFITLKDNVIANNEADSRNNVLINIKNIIDGDALIDGEICKIVLDENTAMATLLYAHVLDSTKRNICEIIEVNNI